MGRRKHKFRAGRGWDFGFDIISGMGIHIPSRLEFGTGMGNDHTMWDENGIRAPRPKPALLPTLATPRSSHYAIVLRILQYPKGTIFDGLHFSSLTLQAYSDVDWAGDPIDRRSTTGYYFFLGDSLISWRSKKQTIVTCSNTKGEYRALVAITAELIGYICYYRVLVLTVPLQLNFTVIIEVLFKLLIMMSSMNVLNILRLIVTSFVIICFRVHSHFNMFSLRIS